MMSNIQYSQDAQKQLDAAENKLGDALKTLKSQIKDPHVEIIPEPNRDEDVNIEVSREQKREPRRSEFVETDDPKVKERINDLYRQVKGADARNQMILDHNRLMEQKLVEYQDKLEKFERSTKDSASDRIESELKMRLRTAREEHDLDTIEQIEDKLLDLRLEKRIPNKIPEQKTQQINPAQQQIDQQLVHGAAYVQHVSQEKDQHGNLIRPYLYDWHPDNKKAVELFQSIPHEFIAAGKQPDMRAVIEALDERMAGKKKQPASVLSGDGDDIPERRTVKLTQEQLHVAKRMGITKEQYARQLSMING